MQSNNVQNNTPMASNVLGGVPNSLDTMSNSTRGSNTALAGPVINHDELIITKSENPKTSQTTKNSRYISRITDAIDKMNKRDELSDHDKMMLNLMMCWTVRMQRLTTKQFDNESALEKYNNWVNLLHKFDTDTDDYEHYLYFLQKQVQEYVQPTFDSMGIGPDNFMRKNYDMPDIYGFSTFAPNKYVDFADLELKGKDVKDTDKPEDTLPESVPYENDKYDQPIPKLLHIVYYKKEVDLAHIYKHLATYTANRDYKIIIWMYQFPKNGMKSGENVEFRLFNDLKDVNEVFDYSFNEENELETATVFDKYTKYKLKYYILKKYGGIYTDYSTYGVKKFDHELPNTNFISVFEGSLRDMYYACPLGVFMGFAPDHPYINYIIENFEKGCDTCVAEYVYLRSALLKCQDDTIRLLVQDIVPKNLNRCYIRLYEEESAEIKYFAFSDFDSLIENADADADANAVTDSKSDELALELQEIDDLANNTIARKNTSEQGTWSITTLTFIFLIGLLVSWFKPV